MTCLKRCMTCVSFVLAWVLFFISCGHQTPVFQCEDDIGCVDIAPGQPVKLGVLQALSGKVGALGREQMRGLELAMERSKGMILGHGIELLVEDTGCTGEGGANAALKIIADPDVVAIFGTTCSGAARTASQVMSRSGLTMISGSNSAPFLTSINEEKAPDWQEGYFRVSNNEEHSGRAAAMYAYNTLGMRQVAVIHDGDIYTRGLAEGFTRSFEQLGGKVVLNTSVSKGEPQMGPVLTAVAQSGAQLVFFPLFQPEGNWMVKEAKGVPELANVILMSCGALIEQSFIDDVWEQGIGMYFVGPSKPVGPEARNLDQRYNHRFKEPPATSYYLYAYDAALLLFDVIGKIAVKEPDGTLHLGRSALRQAMYTMKNHSGITGRLSCDEFGDCSVPGFAIYRLDDPWAGVKSLLDNEMKRYTFD